VLPLSVASPFLLAAYAFGRGAGLGHMLLGAVVRGLIYAVIFKLLRHLSLPEAIILVVVVVGGVFLFSRSRSRRRTW